MDIRTITAAIIAPIMRVTGFRFDKSYRRADISCTGKVTWKGLIYKLCSTPAANNRADGL